MNLHVLSIAFLSLFFAGAAIAQEAARRAFSVDSRIQGMAEAYSLDAIDHARSNFGIVLDWSDRSIANVEKILAQMSQDYVSSSPKPSDDEVSTIAKGYGGYLGEVYRRNHGGEWGLMTLNGDSFPAFKARSGSIFWPVGRVLNRIKNGAEDNVLFYYRNLSRK